MSILVYDIRWLNTNFLAEHLFKASFSPTVRRFRHSISSDITVGFPAGDVLTQKPW